MTLKTVQSHKLSAAESLYLSAAKARAKSATWLDDLRDAAATRFAETGLPHRRVEAWKYTDLRAADRAGFLPAEPGTGTAKPSVFSGDGFDEIIIRNGFVDPAALQALSLKGLRVLSVREALTKEPALLERTIGGAQPVERGALYALNLALMNDGVVIVAEAGARPERPLVLRYFNDSLVRTSVHVRNVVVAEAGAQLTLIEQRDSGACVDFLNVVTDLQIDEKARVQHYRFDKADEGSLTVLFANANLGTGARYENVGLSAGGKMARLETQVRFTGRKATAALGGVLAGAGHDHIDHTTLVRHDAPECSCEEEFRAILGGHAQGVFQGQISVAPDAQKTDSRMLMRCLLLSESASMRGKPELEIYADDVKCAHGTSVGSLDDEALFYMRSRGIPQARARALLVDAFSQDVVGLIDNDAVREVFEDLLAVRLGQIAGEGTQ